MDEGWKCDLAANMYQTKFSSMEGWRSLWLLQLYFRRQLREKKENPSLCYSPTAKGLTAPSASHLEKQTLSMGTPRNESS